MPEELSGLVEQVATDTPYLRIKEGNVAITEEGYDMLLALLAVTSLASKPPINTYALNLLDAIGKEQKEWLTRRN